MLFRLLLLVVVCLAFAGNVYAQVDDRLRCQADLDSSGVVDFWDFNLFATVFGQRTSLCDLRNIITIRDTIEKETVQFDTLQVFKTDTLYVLRDTTYIYRDTFRDTVWIGFRDTIHIKDYCPELPSSFRLTTLCNKLIESYVAYFNAPHGGNMYSLRTYEIRLDIKRQHREELRNVFGSWDTGRSSESWWRNPPVSECDIMWYIVKRYPERCIVDY